VAEPVGRLRAQRVDVGDLAAFPVGDAARHLTGTIIPVDGGQHLPA